MNKEFLYDLLSTGSVSGNEAAIEKKFYDYMQDKADEVTVDELGNVTAAINTTFPSRCFSRGTRTKSASWSPRSTRAAC